MLRFPSLQVGSVRTVVLGSTVHGPSPPPQASLRRPLSRFHPYPLDLALSPVARLPVWSSMTACGSRLVTAQW